MSSPRLKYHKGLHVDRSEWNVLRDTYSLLDPAQPVPRTPRFAFSTEPFLILQDQFGRHGFEAGIDRNEQGRKTWWLQWLEDGRKTICLNPESLQELLYHLDKTIFELRRAASRHPKKHG